MCLCWREPTDRCYCWPFTPVTIMWIDFDTKTTEQQGLNMVPWTRGGANSRWDIRWQTSCRAPGCPADTPPSPLRSASDPWFQPGRSGRDLLPGSPPEGRRRSRLLAQTFRFLLLLFPASKTNPIDSSKSLWDIPASWFAADGDLPHLYSYFGLSLQKLP